MQGETAAYLLFELLKSFLFGPQLLGCTLLYQLKQFSYFPFLILFIYPRNKAKRRGVTLKLYNFAGRAQTQNGQAQVA